MEMALRAHQITESTEYGRTVDFVSQEVLQTGGEGLQVANEAAMAANPFMVTEWLPDQIVIVPPFGFGNPRY